MKNLTSVFLATAFVLTASAQGKTEAQLEEMYYQEQYDNIISKYSGKKEELSAVSLYFVGRAYYMIDQEDACIEYMDLAISKDPENPLPHYIKGYALIYRGRYAESTVCFSKAITLEPDNFRFYSGLGDGYYYQDKNTEAIEAYQKAMLQPDCSFTPFYNTGLIYIEQNEADKAQQVLLAAKEKTAGDKDDYADVLYNLGYTWIMKNDYAQAEAIYNELYAAKPEEYATCARFMQIYYHRKEYSKAQPWRDKLYEAYQNGSLATTDVEDGFCFDEYKWGPYTVYAYERYQTPPHRVKFDKHVFYIIPDRKSRAVLTVTTEYIPGSEEKGQAQYELCAHKGSLYFKSGVVFNDNPDYETLKAEVLKMMEGHLD
jgi:tetratricopeptide (TPR) repeat protein